MSTITDFSAESLTGTPIDLGQFNDHVLLVVNTASRCGFAPQLAGLDALHRTYRDRGFAVLAFPSNQFHQEPRSNEQIGEVCQARFDVSFPLFRKVDVNGAGAHPLWSWLKHERGGVLSSAIKWNFTKFLVGRDGHVINRYPPNAEPESLTKDIERALDVPRRAAA